MATYLISLSLGPVQSLIEAARRTRDLWCGSWLLSECARAAARGLHQAQPRALIFPCPDDPELELEPQREPGDAANIANILRAQVDLPDPDAARALCEQAKAAARERLIALGDQARRTLEAELRNEVWNAQIGDLLELFAAWAEIPEGANGYAIASERVGRTLAARKATRDFAPALSLATSGLLKSSLDGALETVLPKDWSERHLARRRLGLARGEQLDALGVTKRLAGKPEQFTAYSRIAADPWIRSLDSDQVRTLAAVYEPLVRPGLATRVTGNADAYVAFPYDAQLLYDFRLEAALTTREDSIDTGEHELLKRLRAALRALPGQAGAPVPYAVILKADGDRMGALLHRATSADDSRAVSRALHGFASRVRAIVREHHGHAIYAGGDDVLALLPLPDAEPCAAALARAFRQFMGDVTAALGIAADPPPTLSVGIGIGHLMEPLGSLRARAARAEHLAKGDGHARPRNALAIVLGIRSGAELTWRANWDDADAFGALHGFVDAYRDGRLPSRVAYDLRAIDRRLAWLRQPGAGIDDAMATGMRAAEVARTLDRARTEGGGECLSEGVRTLVLQRVEREPLAELADTLILARWLSARVAADLGERGQ